MEEGYNPVNPKDLTPLEAYSKQLNSTALMMIRNGLSVSERKPYLNINSFKQLWDALVFTKTGNTTLQQSRYEIAKSDMHYFMREGRVTPRAP